MLLFCKICLITLIDGFLISKAISINPRFGDFYYQSSLRHSGCCRGFSNLLHYKSKFIAPSSNLRHLQKLPDNENLVKAISSREKLIPLDGSNMPIDELTPIISPMDLQHHILKAITEHLQHSHTVALRLRKQTIPIHFCYISPFKPYEKLICFRCREIDLEGNGIGKESSLESSLFNKNLEEISSLKAETTTPKSIPISIYRNNKNKDNDGIPENGGDAENTITTTIATRTTTTTDMPPESRTFKTMLYAAKHYGY